MAKGNHVFNSFDKVIHKIHRHVLELDGKERDLDAVSGSGTNMTEAETRLTSKFKNSYHFLKLIRDHEKIAQIHTTQDDRAVIADDGNSKAFGAAADNFDDAVWKWATRDEAGDPLESWRQLINVGTDIAAQESYVNDGSSDPGTPNSKDLRRKRCVELSAFVKGDLTALVRKWLLAIRQDLQNRARKVEYKPDNLEEWKNLLKA